MFSLLETVEKLRRNETVSEQDLRTFQNSTNAVERFLAHTSLSMLSMQAARDHLIDAMRAIDHADPQILQTYLDLCKLLKQPAGVAQATVKFALAMVERKQWSVAFDAIMQAIQFDQGQTGELMHDQDIWSDISSSFELASRTLGRSVHASTHQGGPLRVGMLTSELSDNSATERLISGWLRHANPEMASLRVYSTEALSKARRHRLQLTSPASSSTRSGARVIAELKACRIEPWLSPADADAIQTSRMLTERLVRDHIELLFVDSTLADGAVGMSVAGRPVSCQIAIDRGTPVPTSGIDQVIHVNAHLPGESDPYYEKRGIRSRSIFQGIEVSSSTPASRRDYGLSDDAVVMMTCCENLSEWLSAPFVKMIARLLAENPRAVYLVSGEGETAPIRSLFEEAGVSKRVGFANSLKDPAAFISMADLYVAEFPRNSRDGILHAMSAGKPVMVLAGDYDAAGNARFVGTPHAVVGSTATMLDRCSAMLRDRQLRAVVGSNLKRRAIEKFGMRNTIDELMRLVVERIAQRQVSASATLSPAAKLAA